MSERDTKSYIREVIPYIIIVLIALFLRIVILISAYIPSGSMIPMVAEGSRVIGLKCSYWFSEPKRGDVVVFEHPDEEGTLLLKRVIGLPGETVYIENGIVYINDEPLEEDYLAEPMRGTFGPYQVPEGCYFMLGDNRNVSLDARYWENTYVSKDSIMGKVYFSYWPKLKTIK